MPAKKKTTKKKAAKKTTKKKAAKKKTTKKKAARRKPAAKRAATKKKAKKSTAKRKTTKRPAKKKPARKAVGRKTASRRTTTRRKTAKAKTKRKPSAAFMRPMALSPELGAVVGTMSSPRTEVTKRLWAYIKRNNLQDSVNRRMINADDKLRRIFGGKGKVSMFEMTKLVSKHMK
jgi:chromatin remodeling complex protein RSC6